MKTSGRTRDRTFRPTVEKPVFAESVQDERAEAADRAFLDRDEDLVPFGKLPQQRAVEGLSETRIRHRGGEAHAGQRVGSLQGFGQPGAERQKRDLLAFAHDTALADLQRNADGRHFHADAFASRIAQRRGSLVVGHLGRHIWTRSASSAAAMIIMLGRQPR